MCHPRAVSQPLTYHSLAAGLAGVVWGLTPPGTASVFFVLAGGAAAGQALQGRPLHDMLRGALLGAVWMAVFARWVPGAWTDAGAPAAEAAFAVLVLSQAIIGAVVTGVASLAHRRGQPIELALALAWAAATPVVCTLSPLPLTPGALTTGTLLALWPAAVGGHAALTFMAVLASAGLPRFPSAIAMGTWILFGGWALKMNFVRPDLPIGVALPDVAALDGHRASTAPARAERLQAAVDRAVGDGAVVVFTPETSWPEDLGRPEGAVRRRFSKGWRGAVPVLLGARAEGRNVLAAVRPAGTIGDTFVKQRALPVHEVAALGLGEGSPPALQARTLSLGDLEVAPFICYEDLFSGAAREALTHDPDLLVAATNDVWTADGLGSAWHLGATRLLALSTGRWVVRPANGGFSAVLDPMGRTAWSADPVDEGPGRSAVVLVERRHPSSTGAQREPWLALAALLGLWWRRPT